MMSPRDQRPAAVAPSLGEPGCGEPRPPRPGTSPASRKAPFRSHGAASEPRGKEATPVPVRPANQTRPPSPGRRPPPVPARRGGRRCGRGQRIAGDAAVAGAGLASAASCRPATSARPAAARGWAGDHVTHALTVVASLALGPAHPGGEGDLVYRFRRDLGPSDQHGAFARFSLPLLLLVPSEACSAPASAGYFNRRSPRIPMLKESPASRPAPPSSVLPRRYPHAAAANGRR